MENSVTFDPSLDYGATFRFPVTWSYLTEPAHPVQPNQKQATPAPGHPQSAKPVPLRNLEAVQDPQPVPRPAKVNVEPPPAPVATAALMLATKPTEPTEPRASGPEAKWEMVIPKMVRPITLRTASRTPRALPQPAQPQAPAEAAVAPTEISFYADSEASFLPRRWKVRGLSAAAVVMVCAIAWVRPGSDAGSASDSAPPATGTWSRRTAYVVGSKNPREILVYSGSEGVKNYRIEFAWVPDPQGVGWIFRATDSANYYAAKLRLLQAGATPMLSLEHFAVIKGVEGAHSRKIITLGRTTSEVLVRMDATGPAFTLYLQGTPADYWTDGRFESGSLGFYQERGERPVLQALRFTLFKKSGLQTVVTSLQ